MEWLVPSIGVDFGFKLAVCLVLFLNYFETGESFIFWWAFGWALYALSVFFELMLSVPFLQFSFLAIDIVWFLKHVCWALMGVIFLKSILTMRNIRDHLKITVLLFFAVFIAFFGAFIIGSWFWLAWPAAFINGLSLIACAFYFKGLKSNGTSLGNNFIFYGFLLNGLYNLEYPPLRMVEEFAPWGFLISAILAIIFAVGLVIRSGFQVRKQQNSVIDSTKKLSALYSVSSVSSRIFEPEEVFKEVLRKITKILNMDVGVLYLLDEEKKLLVPKSHFNLSSALKAKLDKPLVSGKGWAGKVAKTGEMRIANDVSASSETWAEIGKAGLTTLISFPLKIREKIIGVIEFGSYSSRILTQAEIDFVSSLVKEASVVIKNARLYSYVKKTAQELGALHNISLIMTNYLDMDNMLDEVLKRAVETMRIEAGSVYVINHKHNNLILRAHIGLSNEFIEDIRSISVDANTVTAQIAKSNKPVFVSDLSIYPTIKQKAIKKEGLGGYCGAPINSAQGKVIGVLVVTSHATREFADDEVQLLASIADEIGAAIESARLYEDLQDVYLRSVTALAEVVDAKDHYTYSHSKYVTTYTVKVAREIGLSDREIEDIRKACQLHDIGKISISDYILTKKRKLNRQEWEEVKKHPLKGAAILEPLTFLKEPHGGVVELVKQHHERYDGKGYPLGLKEKDIKIGARIMAVVDAYHAMISTRPYRKALTQKKAVQELKRCSGTQFDPEVARVFLGILAKENK